jgi:hypothetical protein
MLDWNELTQLIRETKRVFVKKLSRNDCSWADTSTHHQSGVYVPKEIQDFFPKLTNSNKAKPHIFEATIRTVWVGTGETRDSKLKHYSNKGAELHMTRIPKDQFTELTPASLLVGGALPACEDGLSCYWFAVLDAASDEAELFESMFSLDADFHHGVLNPADFLALAKDDLELLVDEVTRAYRDGKLPEFLTAAGKLPSPEVMAGRAQAIFLQRAGVLSLNPYALPNPGDAVMRISRDIEFDLYKKEERRHRAAQVLDILLSEGADRGPDQLVSAVVRGFARLDAAFLSASQYRKSRAGRSFEHHIARMLRDGNVRFEAQSVTGGRRPDFVLPSLEVLRRKQRAQLDALVLSAKTTLRERWKQVALEKFDCDLFLATVDDRVSAAAIADMEARGIVLVVPESLKNSSETFYGGSSNVITFADFFNELADEREGFLLAANSVP